MRVILDTENENDKWPATILITPLYHKIILSVSLEVLSMPSMVANVYVVKVNLISG